jgi:hypothetical protein
MRALSLIFLTLITGLFHSLFCLVALHTDYGLEPFVLISLVFPIFFAGKAFYIMFGEEKWK